MKNVNLKQNIDNYINSKNFLLIIACASLISNTQKLSYTYMQESFDFSKVEGIGYVGFILSWMMVVATIITIEISILIFINKGYREIGILFAFIIFMLNMDYFTPSNIFDREVNLETIRLLVRCFLLSIMSPTIVYSLSELYVKIKIKEEEELATSLKQNIEGTIEQIKQENKELETKLLEQKNNNKELLSKVSHGELLIEQSNDTNKQLESKLKHYTLSLEQIKIERDALSSKWNEYELQRTCSDCGTIFDTINQKNGHQNKYKGKCGAL